MPLQKAADAKRRLLNHDLAPIMAEVWRVSLPAGAAVLFMNASTLITSMFVGQRLGPTDMAHLAAGQLTFNICALTIGIGLIGALDTFCPQAFGRNPNSPEIGEWLQRALIIVTAVAVVCSYFFLHAEGPLRMLFQPDLAHGAAVYLSNSWLLLWNCFVEWALMAAVNALRQTHLSTVAFAASMVQCCVLNYLYLDSLPSAAWILAATTGMTNLILVFFICRHPKLYPLRLTKWPISDNTLTYESFVRFFEVGLPTMISVCAEWWAWDGLTIIASTVGEDAVAVLQICSGILYFCFVFTSSFNRGAAITVGNALGANDPELAKKCAKCVMVSIVICQACMSFLIWLMGERMWRLWTDSDRILKYVDQLTPWVMASSFLDGLQFTLQGIYRGVGRPNEAAVRVLCSIWGVGIFSAYILTVHFGVGPVGPMMGIVFGAVVETPLLIVNIRNWDWDKLAEEASRVRNESIAPPVEEKAGTPDAPPAHPAVSSVTPTVSPLVPKPSSDSFSNGHMILAVPGASHPA
jgi:MATE family multidrug resistance protein